jgi:PS-10 peptidase S37
MSRSVLAVVLLLLCACGSDDRLSGDIGERLAQLDGVTVVERTDLVPSTLAGHRFFHLTISQPVDHDDPDGPRFEQRLALLHRADDAPVVLYGGGYDLPATPGAGRVELTRLVEGNQIIVEHRFFTPSRPEPADWSKLTIAQSAADYHAIVEMGKQLYPDAKWLVTGGSKGGETAIFHRRFYPDDVDGTVAYVAPLVLGAPDDRFVPYLQSLLDASCGPEIAAFQRKSLTSGPDGWRDQLAARLEDSGYTYYRLGIQRALEHAVLETPFAMFQYASIAECERVAGLSTSFDAWDFIDDHARWYAFADASLEQYGPYFYQSAVELGFPLIDESAVADLLMFPMSDVASVYAPAGVSTAFDATAMTDVRDWIASSGETLMFLYGTSDPWTAARVDLGDAEDSYVFDLIGGNHGTRIDLLPEAQRLEATAIVRRWVGRTGPPEKSGDRLYLEKRPGFSRL